MGEFRVDPEVLAAVTDRMNEFERRLEAKLEQLTAHEQALGSSWDGTAGQAQAAAQQSWENGAQEMRQALSDLRRITTGASENYHGAMRTNLGNWS